MWTTLVLVATIVAFIFYRANRRPSKFPPGPLSLPIIGSVLSLTPSPKEAFHRFHKLYGDACSFSVFGRWTVMIHDPGLLRTAASDSRFAARPDLYLFLSRNAIISGKEQPLGIIGTHGEAWKQQRRFALRTLKDQGFGRQTVEPVIQGEVEELGYYLASKANQPLLVGTSFNRSIVNVIWAMVVGKRFSYDDERLQELVVKVNRMLQSFDPFSPLLSLRFIKKLLPNLEIYQKVDGYMKDLLMFIQDQMEEYMKDLGDTDDPGSYLGVYLKEMENRALEEDKDSHFTMHHLKANIIELFVAGSETTSSTLCWGFYFMSLNPEIQQKVQQEIDEVIGKDNTPSLDHIDSLPYTTATIYEIQRKADLVPFAVPHFTTDDVTLGDYMIPKGTFTLLNLSNGLGNTKYWKNAEGFDPEHFLTPDGKVSKPDHFMPFGHGKRVCLGESLARQELFLFFTSLMQQFSWKLSDDPVTWEKSTILSRPPNYSVIISERNK